MSDYTPTTEDLRAFIQAADRVVGGIVPGSSLDAFDRWLAARDAEVRASVLAEQGEPDDYWVFDAHGNFWASSSSLDDARHYLAQEPGGHIEAIYRNRRLPVEESKPDTMTACCTTSEPCEKHRDARHQEVPSVEENGENS